MEKFRFMIIDNNRKEILGEIGPIKPIFEYLGSEHALDINTENLQEEFLDKAYELKSNHLWDILGLVDDLKVNYPKESKTLNYLEEVLHVVHNSKREEVKIYFERV